MSKDYLSKENTKALKGIFAVFVLWHHLYQYSALITGTVIGIVFQAMGYLSVGMFFFLSGYGLTTSYRNRGGYIDTFLRKKVLTLYIDILLFTGLFYFFNAVILTDSISLSSIIKSITFGGTIVPLGWYLQVAIILYVLFYLTFRFIKDEKSKLVCIFIACITFAVILHMIGYSSTWFEGIIAFPFGSLVAFNKNEIDSIINNKKRNIICVLFGFISFCLAFVFAIIIKNELRLIVKSCSVIWFIVMVISVVRAVPNVNNRVTDKLGEASFEIYILQGLFLWI